MQQTAWQIFINFNFTIAVLISTITEKSMSTH